jgi:hypothetical protein
MWKLYSLQDMLCYAIKEHVMRNLNTIAQSLDVKESSTTQLLVIFIRKIQILGYMIQVLIKTRG